MDNLDYVRDQAREAESGISDSLREPTSSARMASLHKRYSSASAE